MKDVMIEILEEQIQELTNTLQDPYITHKWLIEATIISRSEKRKELEVLKSQMNIS